jgi:hypothetical protein
VANARGQRPQAEKANDMGSVSHIDRRHSLADPASVWPGTVQMEIVAEVAERLPGSDLDQRVAFVLGALRAELGAAAADLLAQKPFRLPDGGIALTFERDCAGMTRLDSAARRRATSPVMVLHEVVVEHLEAS